MKNYIQPGKALDLTLGADVESGDIVVAGSLCGVAVTDGKSGDVIAVSVCGVFELPKATGSIAQGDKLYFDATAKKVTKTVTGNKFVGFSTVAVASGDTLVNVLLARPTA